MDVHNVTQIERKYYCSILTPHVPRPNCGMVSPLLRVIAGTFEAIFWWKKTIWKFESINLIKFLVTENEWKITSAIQNSQKRKTRMSRSQNRVQLSVFAVNLLYILMPGADSNIARRIAHKWNRVCVIAKRVQHVIVLLSERRRCRRSKPLTRSKSEAAESQQYSMQTDHRLMRTLFACTFEQNNWVQMEEI